MFLLNFKNRFILLFILLLGLFFSPVLWGGPEEESHNFFAYIDISVDQFVSVVVDQLPKAFESEILNLRKLNAFWGVQFDTQEFYGKENLLRQRSVKVDESGVYKVYKNQKSSDYIKNRAKVFLENSTRVFHQLQSYFESNPSLKSKLTSQQLQKLWEIILRQKAMSLQIYRILTDIDQGISVKEVEEKIQKLEIDLIKIKLALVDPHLQIYLKSQQQNTQNPQVRCHRLFN